MKGCAMPVQDFFGAKDTFDTGSGKAVIYRLSALEKRGYNISRLPFSIRVLLEAALRQADGFEITANAVETIANWGPETAGQVEIPFKPARVVLQDFTGVPSVVDLAALRDAMARLGGDPRKVNPLVPVDLVVDHSVQVDQFGSVLALFYNAELEFERNRERYEFLKWGQGAFDNFRVVPPATGIVHQVNLEYLANVVQLRPGNGDGVPVAYPDSLVGTDSHTTMINGLGVVGWGVGGIEAESVMLGQPMYFLLPQVVGFKLTGELPEGATATDLVLRVTEMLRKKGVVDKFVEFYGPGVGKLTLADRATIANMAPEYGATTGFFPVDEETLRYLVGTGRSEELVELVERYCKEQGLFRTDATPDPVFSDTLELDMSTVRPALAGPKRPQDRVDLAGMKSMWNGALTAPVGPRGFGLKDDQLGVTVPVSYAGRNFDLKHGDVVIAAITSCTNTSNPSVMVGAGLLAKKAVERGLDVKPWVKTSMAPGSQVVTRYLDAAGLTPYLEALNFHTVGYGCTTCIGNSGPLPEPISKGDQAGRPGRRGGALRQPQLRGPRQPGCARQLPGFAAAGRRLRHRRHDEHRPGDGAAGLRPQRQPGLSARCLADAGGDSSTIRRALKPEMFREQYANVFDGNPQFNAVKVAGGDRFAWDPASTYIQEPPSSASRARFRRRAADPGCAGARLYRPTARRRITSARRATSPRAAPPPAIWKIARPRRDFNSYGSAPRQPRSDDARHLRQHPHQEPDAAGHRGRASPATSPPARRWRSTTRRKSTWPTARR
jgi:aconitate hydratase